jgi:8-oxo-dGTP diphosphatase
MTERAVLVFLLRGSEVLLIHKLRGLGMGKINAPGGRLEAGESWLEAGARELQEETLMSFTTAQEVAALDFVFTNGYHLDVRAFVASGAQGTPHPTEEADPFWCRLDAIPWNRMWKDDALWLPHALGGLYVRASFLFEDDAMLSAKCRVSERSMTPIIG